VVSGRRRREQRVVAELPDLPDQFDPAPDAIESGASWYGVCADASLTLPEHVYDLELVECVWRDVDASSCRFSGFRCRDVRFERCDLSAAVLDNAALTRVHFIGCRLTGVVFSGAELSDVVIQGGVAGLANFRGSTSSFLCVRDTSLADADFTGARLRDAALLDCELSGIDLSGARIEGLSVHGSTLDSLRGAAALLDAGLRIDADQVIPLGAALVAALGVTIAPRPNQP
jgi:uncharacterized protein YjbI with pentapeptide repeats